MVPGGSGSMLDTKGSQNLGAGVAGCRRVRQTTEEGKKASPCDRSGSRSLLRPQSQPAISCFSSPKVGTCSGAFARTAVKRRNSSFNGTRAARSLALCISAIPRSALRMKPTFVSSVRAATCNPDHSTPTTDGLNENVKSAKGKKESHRWRQRRDSRTANLLRVQVSGVLVCAHPNRGRRHPHSPDSRL